MQNVRKRGMSFELLCLQSLAHALGFQMLGNSGIETRSSSYARQSVVSTVWRQRLPVNSALTEH
jgi:hypothetical protein